MSPPSPPTAPMQRQPPRHAPVAGLASLPPFLAQSILQMAVPAYEQSKLTVRNVANAAAFRALASVSKPWKALAVDAVSNVVLCSLVVSVDRASRSELLELRRQLTLQRAFLLLLDVHTIPHGGMIGADQWAAALSCAPRVQELKLDSLKDERFAQRGAIVRAAGHQLGHLQSLVISPYHRDNHDSLVPVESMRRELTDPVYYTMEQVYHNTRHVGLRRLCVGMRHDLQGLASARPYMDQVLRFCPNLERFDGFRAAVYAIDHRIAYEQWSMDFDLWTRFCATLTQLVEFDWICVPFATRFFEIFGQHVKPNLKTLVFTTAMNWHWDRYLGDMGPELRDQLAESGYAGTAKHAHAALTACPNLKQLSVYWYNQRPPLVRLDRMDPEIFGDVFWETAVRLCPLLTKVSMVGVSDDFATTTVRAFTDRSLRALARLPRLEYLECRSVNVTGDGILELAVHHAASGSTTAKRFHVQLGTAQSAPTDLTFYDAVTGFLEKMLAADAPLPCLMRTVSMTIHNKRRFPVETEWSESYLANLQQLMHRVKAKHPGVQLYAFAHDCDGTRFSQLREVVFETRDRLEMLWLDEGDLPVGDSLWNRIPMSDSEENNNDDDDMYNDSDDSEYDSDAHMDAYYGDYDYNEYDEFDDDYDDDYDDTAMFDAGW